MRKMMLGLTALLMALAAAAAVIWPAYREVGAVWRREAQAEKLMQVMETMDPALIRKHRNLAMWYNLVLRSGNHDTQADEAYGGILDLGDGAMGVLEVPGRGITLPVYHGGTGQQGVFHRPGTSLPLGGIGNHTVLELGDTYGGGILAELEAGDVIRIRVPGLVLTYRVDAVIRGRGEGKALPGSREGEDLCTLVISGKRETVYLRCSRGEGVSAEPEPEAESKETAIFAAAGTAAGAGIMAWILGSLPRRGREGKNRRCSGRKNTERKV